MIGVIPYVGLNFAVYETLKDLVLKHYGEPDSLTSIDSIPTLTDVAFVLTLSLAWQAPGFGPCSMAARQLRTMSRGSCSVVLWQHLGMHAASPCCTFCCTWHALQLDTALYAGLETLANPPPAAELQDERELSVITRLGCGAVAGTTGQTVAYPLDVVRRRLQVSVPKLWPVLRQGAAQQQLYIVFLFQRPAPLACGHGLQGCKACAIDNAWHWQVAGMACCSVPCEAGIHLRHFGCSSSAVTADRLQALDVFMLSMSLIMWGLPCAVF